MRRPPVPHHSAPCGHPTASGQPCPNRAVDVHPQYFHVCALHAHHYATSEGLTATVIVHLTPEERRVVGVVAGILGVSLSDLARNTLVRLPIPEPPRPRIEVSTYGQLGKIGGNLNQLARSLNLLRSGASESVEVDPDALKAQLDDLREVLHKVRLALVVTP